MAEFSFLQYLRKVKKNDGQFPINIVYGYNEFLGERIIEALCAAFIEKKSDFNYHRFYFDPEDKASWEDVINECNSSNFFVQSRKIIVATLREQKALTLSKAEKELLKKYVQKPNANTILVIYVSLNLMKDDYKQLKKLKIDKTWKAYNGPNTSMVDLDKITDNEIKQYIHSYLKGCGTTITESALDKIIELKEDDAVSILHQLPKLAVSDYKHQGIDSEYVDKIVTGVEAHSIWDLTDAIESEDAKKYLKVLRYLFMNGIKPTLIIGTLITHYNKLFIGKFLLNRGFPSAEIGKVLGMHKFFLNKFISTARNFSSPRLQKILDLIYKLDFQSKTSGEESARLSLQNFAFSIKLATHR